MSGTGGREAAPAAAATGPAAAPPPPGGRPTWAVVGALGTAQTLAYASSYYLPAILAPAVARDLGLPPWALFAGLSGALAVDGLLGPLVGRAVDRTGGRGVLLASSPAFAAGLALLALAEGPLGLALAWAVLGAAMGLGLYDVAFSYLAALRGREARASITGVTLVAGFASTVGWPATAWLEAEVGWRGACLAWAALHLALGPALYLSLPRPPASASADVGPAAAAPAARRQPRGFWTLAFVFAAAGLCNSGMAAHLPGVLAAAGASPAAAVAAAALVGPAQVAARVAEFGLMRRAHPLLSARLATLAHPLGAAALALLGHAAAPAFALLHGAGNGVLTIAKGALPLALFGPEGYGARQGLLSLPASFAFAAAPLLFGLLLDRLGLGAVAVSGGLALAASLALLALRPSGVAPPR